MKAIERNQPRADLTGGKPKEAVRGGDSEFLPAMISTYADMFVEI